MESVGTLQWPDYVILAVFLTISLGIGVYQSLTGGRQRTTSEFIVANRRLHVIPTALSLVVSFQSAIGLLGLTAEMYQYGIQNLVWVPVGYLIAISVSIRLIVPWIYPLQLLSVNDYLERRFNSKAVRIFGSFFTMLEATFYMSVAMYAPSVALESVTGLSIFTSIPLMALFSVAYTALGGMRAVIWTDVFQCAAMIGGMLAIFIKAVLAVGGFSRVLEICASEGRTQFANWSPDPRERHTVWGLTIGISVFFLRTYGISQACVQRFSATKSMKDARMIMLLNMPAVMFINTLACSIGLAVFSYFSTSGCDPLAYGNVQNPNQILPLFVMIIFKNSPGFAGLFMATLYGGALSSVSSSLSGAAANCWDDILRLKLSHLSELKKTLITRLLVVVFGALAAAIAFLAATVPGPITQIYVTFLSVVGGPVLGMYIMGGMSRHTNWKGVIIGSLSGMLVLTWITVGARRVDTKYPTLPPTDVSQCSAAVANNTLLWRQSTVVSDWTTTLSSTVHQRNETSPVIQDFKHSSGLSGFYFISYTWLTLIGASVAVVVGLAVSLTFRDRKAEECVDERLLIPFRQCTRCDNDIPVTHHQTINEISV